MRIKTSHALLILFFLASFWAYFQFNLGQYHSLDWVKSQQASLRATYHANPLVTLCVFASFYIFTTALSLPGATVLTLFAGALFGFVPGLILVSFASTLGASLAFLSSRFLFYQGVQKRFGASLQTFNRGIETEGGLYLFSLRLVPLFPFFLVNLLMGLTPIKARSFYLISQVGMLPGTILYVFAGTELSQIDSLSGILSPGMITAFVGIGLFPLITRKVLNFIKKRIQDS